MEKQLFLRPLKKNRNCYASFYRLTLLHNGLDSGGKLERLPKLAPLETEQGIRH